MPSLSSPFDFTVVQARSGLSLSTFAPAVSARFCISLSRDLHVWTWWQPFSSVRLQVSVFRLQTTCGSWCSFHGVQTHVVAAPAARSSGRSWGWCCPRGTCSWSSCVQTDRSLLHGVNIHIFPLGCCHKRTVSLPSQSVHSPLHQTVSASPRGLDCFRTPLCHVLLVISAALPSCVPKLGFYDGASVWACVPSTILSRTSHSPVGLSFYPAGLVLSCPVMSGAIVPVVHSCTQGWARLPHGL